MSSRILRGTEALPAEALLFRTVGGGVARAAEPRGAQRVASADGDAGIQALIQAAVEQGRQEGHALAQRQAAQKASEEVQRRLEPVLGSLRQMLESLAAQRQRLRAESEEDMVRLAIAIARRVLHREMSADPEAILGVVKAAFARLNAREIHRLRISPQDAQIIGEHRSALHFPAGLEVASDGSLVAGCVVFETARGELDASVDTQLAEIDRGLTDILRRRP